MKNKYAWIPSPLAIALLLWLAVFLMAWLGFKPENASALNHLHSVFQYSYEGMWGSGGLAFLVQMALMLVLGHVLALSRPVRKLLELCLRQIRTSNQAVVATALLAMVAGFINWGFGLIIGAVFAKSVIDYFGSRGQAINAPLVAACGYTGLLIWHGGISGSSLIKIAEPGHLASLTPSVYSESDYLDALQTVFSSSNLVVFAVMLVAIAYTAKYLNSRSTASEPTAISEPTKIKEASAATGLDHARWAAYLFGGLILVGSMVLAFTSSGGLSFLNPNFINFTLLGLAVVGHGSFSQFTTALDEAIGGSSGILIQFPIYFAIMGIMSGSGMVTALSEFFISISGPNTLPLFTFFSAGIVNLMVPSGGGQWMIQGPIIIESCQNLGIPLQKGVMALAYGDQLTNMLQPFWALPLLGITKVKAHQLLPYTFVFFLVGLVVFGLSLVVL